MMDTNMMTRQVTSPLASVPSDQVAVGNRRNPSGGLPRSKSLVFDEDQMEMPHVHSCIGSMQQGVTMMKVKGPSHTITRTFYLDQDRCAIRWKPSRKADAKISIDSIREIREGACTDTFVKHAEGQFDPACCFSIIHGNQCETLDLVARQRDDVMEWIVGLKFVLAGVSDEDSHTRQQRLRDQWLKSTFKSADKSGDGLLSIGEVIMLLHRLNVNLSKRKVRQMFKEADTNVGDQNEGLLDFDEFVNFYKRISTRRELYLLLLRYGNGKEYMTAAELSQFLEMEQKMFNVSLRHCLDIIKNFEPVPENVRNGWLGIDGFSRFLLSREGDLFNQAHTRVHQDMTRPLSHYFIATSHNTYLVGDQLLSKSSMDVYAFVLQSGCRCVEVDCWDGPDGEPIVYHGYTLTSKIPFKNVIQTINKYAFVSSPYPVIVSLENHCCLQQQKKMAAYMVEVFGDKLNLDRPDPRAKYLPSPEQLKYKILIKAKKLPPDLDLTIDSGEVSDEDSADEMDEQFKLKDSIRCIQVESLARAKLASLARESASPTRRINFKFPRMSPSKRSRSKSFSEGAFPDMEAAQYLHSQRSSSPKEGKRRTSLSATFGKLKLTKKKRSSLPALEPMDSHTEETIHCSEYAASARLQQGKLRIRTRRTSEIAIQNRIRRHSSDTTSTASSASSSRENLDSVDQRRKHSLSFGKKNTMMLSRQLSDLVKYTISVGSSDFTFNTPCWELPSFGESKAFQLAVNKAQQFCHFNKRKLSRGYPAAYRIDSSNFNPQPMWNCGLQLVALNYQTDGKSMQLNNAKFSANGQCGYILKPDILCDENYIFEPHSTEPFPGVTRQQLCLRIISGQQLPKPPQSILGERGEIIDPYVEVEIVGLPIDCARRQTQTITDNGFNPVWDETMVFTLHLPALALVRFVVWDEDPIGRDFIGQKTLPFTSLAPGYRHIHLEGLEQASLFVHVSINNLTDRLTYRGLKKKSHSKPALTRQTTIDTPERVTRKSSFINRLKRRSSMPNMLSGNRKPRTPVVTYNDPPNSAMKHSNSEDSDKGRPKKKTVTFVTPVTYVLPGTVDNWLRERNSRYIGPVEIRMLLDYMSVSQLLTAIREDQLLVNVIIDSALSRVKNVMLKKPLTPPCYEEAIKRSKMFRRHHGGVGVNAHIRRELSSSLSSMSTVLPETPVSTTDSHDSSSFTSDSSHDPFRNRPRGRGDPRSDMYKLIMSNMRSGNSVPQRNARQNIPGGIRRIEPPPPLDFSILNQIHDEEERMSRTATTSVTSPEQLIPLAAGHTKPTLMTPAAKDTEGSTSSEYRETDTLSDLTSSSSNASDNGNILQPANPGMVGRYRMTSEQDTKAEERQVISTHHSMQEVKQIHPGHLTNHEVTAKYRPADHNPKPRSPVKIFGIFCSPKTPEETKGSSLSPRVATNSRKETGRERVDSNGGYGSMSKEENLPDVIQVASKSAASHAEPIKPQEINDLNRASNGPVSIKRTPEPNPGHQENNVKGVQDETVNIRSPNIRMSNDSTTLKAVSPEISINVTATDDIWSENWPHSSDSEDNLSISDSSPNVTLDRLMKHLAKSPDRGPVEKERPRSPDYVNISSLRDGFQASGYGRETVKEMNAKKPEARSTVLASHNKLMHHTETQRNSYGNQENKVQTHPQKSSLSRSYHSANGMPRSPAVSSSFSETRNSPRGGHRQDIMLSIDATLMDSKLDHREADTDTSSTTSSSSADTVVDMSLDCLGKLQSNPSLEESNKSASLDTLSLQDIFDQSEYQSFVNHVIRRKKQKNSMDSPVMLKRKLKLPHKRFQRIYSAQLKDSAKPELKQRSASTSSLLDQLKKLTSLDDEEEMSPVKEPNSDESSSTQEYQTRTPSGVSGRLENRLERQAFSDVNSNNLVDLSERSKTKNANGRTEGNYSNGKIPTNSARDVHTAKNFTASPSSLRPSTNKHLAIREYTPKLSHRNHVITPSRDKLVHSLPPFAIQSNAAQSTPRSSSRVNAPIFPTGRPVKAVAKADAYREFQRREPTANVAVQSQQSTLNVRRFGTGVFGLMTSPTRNTQA